MHIYLFKRTCVPINVCTFHNVCVLISFLKFVNKIKALISKTNDLFCLLSYCRAQTVQFIAMELMCTQVQQNKPPVARRWNNEDLG